MSPKVNRRENQSYKWKWSSNKTYLTLCSDKNGQTYNETRPNYC